MSSFNRVILMGNLTRDPELRVTPNGNSICKLGLATSRVYSTKDGERREETTFVDIDAFGKQADVIAKYMKKGRPILVEGRLKLDQWEADGQKRSKLSVVLENFQFLGSKDDEGDQSTPAPRAAAAPAATAATGADDLSDDAPF